MEAFLIAHDAELRLYALFLGSLVLLLESAFPAIALIESIKFRWARNLALFVLDIALNRIIVPLTSLALAVLTAKQGWGLLNLIDIPIALKILLAILALDATAYAAHVALHRMPWLWRIHAVHHSDQDFDCTTGLRFHPVEALLTLAVRLALITALGIPIIAVVVFEVWAIMAAFYTHANVKIPIELDKATRKLLVTPNMHRIHHSTTLLDNMSNFGVVFSLWDRLFSTYREHSIVPGPVITGLPWFNRRASMGILGLIALPINSAPFKEETAQQTTQGT